MEPNVFDKVKDVDLKGTMESSYIDYAMSVIVSRALPDVRDGLKPVQRRILYAAQTMGATPDKKTKKCATIVGETMGHYHPHGDSSIYGALVNLGQPWTTRYPLIEKQGNFGSDDGDSPAAMRYTEAKLSKIAMEMLDGINKNTVDIVPNFSNEKGYDEPVILPAKFPNLLVNGTTGIAVGMATNIPPHNLREVINAAIKIIDNRINEDRDTDIEELLPIVKGPDFPTGATILGKKGIEEAYRTGRGKIRMRAVCDIETLHNGKSVIVVRELPYQVFRSRVIENIADLVKDKRIDGITAINDTVGKNSDSKIKIELRRDVNPQVVLNQLYKHTQLQDTFGVIMLCIVNGQPKVLNLKEVLCEYLKHQVEVVTRRTQYDLNKCEERAHILEGLLKALEHIDEIIKIIRNSDDGDEAKLRLIEAFGFTDAQAQAIVDMRLRALTGLERHKIESEYKDLEEKIAYYKSILSDKKILLGVIKEEIKAIADKYGDDRRTKIGYYEGEIDMEDLIPDDDTVIAMTGLGYIKRMETDNFKAQNRGGRGIKGMQTINDDYIEDLLMTTNHHYLMFFTNMGKVYRLKAYEIPEAGRTARGTAIVNLLQLMPDEKVTAIIPIKEYDDDKYLLMATKKGMVKKTSLNEYANVRKNGLQAIVLKEDDELIEVKFTDNTQDVVLVTKLGMAIRFHETDVRNTGRVSMGVIGMKFGKDDDEVIGMQVENQGEYLHLVSENGMGKRTLFSEFNAQNRGGKGVLCYKITEKTGNLIGAKLTDEDNEIMLITNEGIIIRIKVSDISVIGRNTSGVKLMNIDSEKNEKIAGITKVRQESSESEDEDNENEDSESEDTVNDSDYDSEGEDI